MRRAAFALASWVSHGGRIEALERSKWKPEGSTTLKGFSDLRNRRFLCSSRVAMADDTRKFRKILVANRGEIAVRVIRACNELNTRAVAVYSEQDRTSLFKQKADESYLIGKGLGPVGAYLSISEIIRVAKEVEVDAIHPGSPQVKRANEFAFLKCLRALMRALISGYGFLSERADFIEACEKNNIKFIGPRSETAREAGDKLRARRAAVNAGIPLTPGLNDPITTVEEAKAFVAEHGLPVILKAAFGGGGRGMRVIHEESELAEALARAMSEAKAAFGNASMYIEKFLPRTRHIEVQIVGDKMGKVSHFFERDCSVQRRHQKVVEIAPAPFLAEDVRRAVYADAVRLAESLKYENAGTVEFLVTEEGKHYFMEVNARLQVEHPVTEEITGVDLVQTQIRIAEGYSLEDLGLNQEKINKHGFSIQCRVTTEDPSENFRPSTGRIATFRIGEGLGIRLDSAAYPGMEVTPNYDSMIAKVISRGRTLEDAANKMKRSLKEARISGVKTNIPFLVNVMQHPGFRTKATFTDFIPEHPELVNVLDTYGENAEKLMNFIANVIVNGPPTPLGTGLLPSSITPKVPRISPSSHAPDSWRRILLDEGPEGLAKAILNHKKLLICDTTMRDAHQSLLATRVRTRDLLRIAPFVSQDLSNLFSLEMWGGATFDVCMRFLKESPWERLKELRKLIPNINFQMLFRGANAVGYTSYPDNVIHEFCKVSVDSGIDIFRIFDSLNYMPNLILGMEAVSKAGGVVEAAICYSGDVSDPSKEKYTLAYYTDLAEQLVRAGTHILCIKDMAGLLKPRAATILVKALKEKYPLVPLHIHTHDTAGAGVATLLACAEAGADIVDVSVDSMSGMTSQPSFGAVVASLQGSDRSTGFDLPSVSRYSAYWEQARTLYGPFECATTMKSGNADVYLHEIPGGQYTNLQFQAYSLGLGDQFEKIKEAYREANLVLGDIIKVTPSSKVVGDLAQFMVQNKLDAKSVVAKAAELHFPTSVVQFMRGLLGQPYGGFPEPFRTHVLKGESKIDERPGENMKPLDLVDLERSLEAKFSVVEKEDVVSAALYPQVTDDYLAFKEIYGPVTKLDTRIFFVGPKVGETFEVKLGRGRTATFKVVTAAKELNAAGEREVFIELDGQLQSVCVFDEKAAAKASSAGGTGRAARPKADRSNKKQVGAPMPGKVLEVSVKEGDKVTKNQKLVVLSAMKMEMVVGAPADGVVKTLLVSKDEDVQGGDLMIVID